MRFVDRGVDFRVNSLKKRKKFPVVRNRSYFAANFEPPRKMNFCKLFFCVILSLSMIACNRPEPEKETITVTVSPTALSFAAEGGTETLSVSSNGLWYVRPEASWIGVSASSGSGNGLVEVTVQPNAGELRSGSVVFETADRKTSVSVSQERFVKADPTVRSIKDIRALYRGSDFTIKEDCFVEGVVISDYRRDTDGGLNNYTSARTIVISDGEAGLMLYCAAENKAFARGQRVRVRLQNQVLSVYADGALQVNGLPLDRIESLGTELPAAKEITVEQLVSGEYECMYVAVRDVQLADEAVGSTFASASENRSLAFQNADGSSFDLFTSRYAVFRDETVPTGSGTLKGIAGKYGSRYQLTLSEKADCDGLTGPRFTAAPFFYIESADRTVSGDAGTFPIHVASNVAWTVRSSDSAFALNVEGGRGAGEVIVTYGDNPSTEEARSTVLTFRVDDPSVTPGEYTLTLRQQPFESLVQSAVQPWLELPAIVPQDGRAFFSHTMTYGGRDVRNYAFLLDLSARVSLWVAYPLYQGMTSGTTRSDKWAYDPLVPKRYQGCVYRSYSGYDRGHQLPSADRLCTASANEQTFYFTNVTPQNSDLNQGLWEKLESKVREQLGSCDTLYVVTGCVLTTGDDPVIRYTQDNDGKDVAVPKAYYKVLLKYQAGAANGGYSAIGFWMENKSYGSTALTRAFARTVDEIETLTGLDFFHNLNDTYEKEAEARYDASAWGL